MSKKDESLKRLAKAFSEKLSGSDIIAAKELAKLSAQICAYRINLHMTQNEFANYLGVSQGMVSKWESEDYNFTVEALAKICDKLDLQLEISLRPITKQYSNIRKFDEFED